MGKTRLNISMDQDLADFAKLFASENRISVAEMITQYLLSLKRKVEGQSTAEVLSHPAFVQAMEEAQAQLRNGTVEWHSYNKVFDD